MSGDYLELRMYDNLIKENTLNISTKKKKWALNYEKLEKEEYNL